MTQYLDELGLPHCSNDDVGLLYGLLEVLRAAVTQRHRGVSTCQKVRNGTSHNVAAPNHTRVLAVEVNARGLDERHASLWRACIQQRERTLLCEPPRVELREAATCQPCMRYDPCVILTHQRPCWGQQRL